MAESGRRCELKEILASKIEKEREKVIRMKREHGSHIVGNVTVDMLLGGMRGLFALFSDTTTVEPDLGVCFRGLTIPQMQDKLPKKEDGLCQPMPEGFFWLLLTGDIPTREQVQTLTDDWKERADRKMKKERTELEALIKAFPTKSDPINLLIAALSVSSCNSRVADTHKNSPVSKAKQWEQVYEDCMDMIATLPHIISMIYRHKYCSSGISGSKQTKEVEESDDWTDVVVKMFEDGENNYGHVRFAEFLRLYMCLHSDHGKGNVSAHATHLIGSAQTDPYLSFAGGMCGLAGPLHGRACHDSLEFYQDIAKQKFAGTEEIEEFIKERMRSGQVIPGFGHAVLRTTDPRYVSLQEFAEETLTRESSELYDLHVRVKDVAISILSKKVSFPQPNVDSISGILLHAFGVDQTEFYTTIFGLSRVLGTSASLIWDRGLCFPIERPKAVSMSELVRITTTQDDSAHL